VTRLIRFRFSLATLLIAMAWSGVAVWVNVTPRLVSGYTFIDLDSECVRDGGVYLYGWPLKCWTCIGYIP
jgi:hypothetical protein